MKGKLVLENYELDGFSNTGVYSVQEPYGYEVHINCDLNDDYMTLISKDYGFEQEIVASLLYYSDDMNMVKFLEDFRRNRMKYIMDAEYIEFNYSIEEISEYIKKNPILKTKKIILNVDFDFNVDFLNKFTCLFGEDVSNIYFNLIGNSCLIEFNEYRDTISKIDMICKDVDRFNFSPLEKIMYVYDIVRDRVYLEVDENEDKMLSRDLSSSLLGKKIVCVGYAKIFRTLLNKLGIDCREILLKNVNDAGGHARCEIYVKDDKYGVDGVYYFDPTWDSKKSENDNRFLYSYKYFAMTKSRMDEIDQGRLIQNKFPYFDNKIISKFSKMVDDVGFENLDRDIIDIINHMAKIVKGNYLINLVGLHSFVPKMFRPDKDNIISELSLIIKYFDRPLSANTLLKVLYNVRKNQFYVNSEKYPLGLNQFYSIVLNSRWEFEKTEYDLLLELLGMSDENRKKEIIIEYARSTGMFKNIQQVKLTHTLRKVLVKKNN